MNASMNTRLDETSQNLCDICRNIDIEKLRAPSGFRHIWREEFSESCKMCGMIYGLLGTGTKGESTPIYLKTYHKELRIGYFATRLFGAGLTYHETSVNVTTCHRDPASTQYKIPTPRQLTVSGSEGTLEISKHWLKYCRFNHFYCSKSLVTSPDSKAGAERDKHINENDSMPPSCSIPTRLLDLEVLSTDSLDVKLVQNLNLGEVAYSTLSYCWGTKSNSRWKTTTETFEEHCNRIHYNDLPKTYQDAISICRKLAIRYLWIDSLCIVQDSKEDWDFQAASMAYIYSNSTVTISADWSQDSEGGCFNTSSGSQNIASDDMVCITNALSDGQKSSLYFFTHYSPDETELDQTHLSTRAWCFQERRLSPRNLHFTANQLFWECREAFGGEDLIPRNHGQLRPAFVLKMYENENSENLIRIWYEEIVPSYSAANLTYPTDRLPAISALSQIFSERLQRRYLAGLWEAGLWYALCWYCTDTSNSLSRRRPKCYIAPSWSWASVNTAVKWDWFYAQHYLEQIANIEGVEVTCCSGPFGKVSDGWIRIKAPVIHNQRVSELRDRNILQFLHLDYPADCLDNTYLSITFILLAESKDKTECLFLLLKRSLRTSNSYERIGSANLRSALLQPLAWPQETITIV